MRMCCNSVTGLTENQPTGGTKQLLPTVSQLSVRMGKGFQDRSLELQTSACGVIASALNARTKTLHFCEDMSGCELADKGLQGQAGPAVRTARTGNGVGTRSVGDGQGQLFCMTQVFNKESLLT